MLAPVQDHVMQPTSQFHAGFVRRSIHDIDRIQIFTELEKEISTGIIDCNSETATLWP